jgi:hypothetical protein
MSSVKFYADRKHLKSTYQIYKQIRIKNYGNFSIKVFKVYKVFIVSKYVYKKINSKMQNIALLSNQA